MNIFLKCYEPICKARKINKSLEIKRKWFFKKWSELGLLPIWRHGLFHFFDIGSVIYNYDSLRDEIDVSSVPACYFVIFGYAIGFCLVPKDDSINPFNFWRTVIYTSERYDVDNK